MIHQTKAPQYLTQSIRAGYDVLKLTYKIIEDAKADGRGVAMIDDCIIITDKSKDT